MSGAESPRPRMPDPDPEVEFKLRVTNALNHIALSTMKSQSALGSSLCNRLPEEVKVILAGGMPAGPAQAKPCDHHGSAGDPFCRMCGVDIRGKAAQ